VLAIIVGAVGLYNGAKPILGYGLLFGGLFILLLTVFLKRSTTKAIWKWLGWREPPPNTFISVKY